MCKKKTCLVFTIRPKLLFLVSSPPSPARIQSSSSSSSFFCSKYNFFLLLLLLPLDLSFFSSFLFCTAISTLPLFILFFWSSPHLLPSLLLSLCSLITSSFLFHKRTKSRLLSPSLFSISFSSHLRLFRFLFLPYPCIFLFLLSVVLSPLLISQHAPS
ncbi:hypothetical protein CSUI_002178 [Cystoisospora suis]|uniref:Transmembrane protein n=1 Tax=Cystoisospora suis TaxID=483139 RepID=A0A2C6L937_9APIC|nr:hypothetical protein CSUI_002178 [Cystoisospora suis]